MYQESISITTGKVNAVVKQDGDFFIHIPFDLGNTDYQQYLEWIAEGNTPLPADEGNQQ